MEQLENNELTHLPVSVNYARARRIYTFFKVGEETLVEPGVRAALVTIHSRYKWAVLFKTKTVEGGLIRVWRVS